MVHQWTHSVLTEPDFVNEWKASIKALDQAFYMNDDPLPHCKEGRQQREVAERVNGDLRVRFHHVAELFVGEEQEHFFKDGNIPAMSRSKTPISFDLYGNHSQMNLLSCPWAIMHVKELLDLILKLRTELWKEGM